MKEITKDWLRSAEDDIKIIGRIIDDDSLTHQVAFHAQQAIEKALKAVMEEYEVKIIRTHSLETLFAQLNLFIQLSVDITIIKKLDQLYIDARYPGNLGLLPNGKPGMRESESFQKTAEEIYTEICNQLK
jgi:HEPN domain-containing protein